MTWNQRELEVLKTYKNVLFFLEEYVTLLAQFLRKISLKNISSIQVDIKTHEQDYDNPDAKKVTILHIQNNFIGLDIAHIDFQYQFSFHESENIFYKIQFVYNGVQVTYVFDEEKYLCIGEKKYIDDYCFDKVLSKIISLN